MLWGLQSVRLFKIGKLEEEAAHFRCEEEHRTKEEQEYRYALYIMHRVIGMELDAIERHAIRALVLFDLHAIRIVRPDFVECQNVQHDQCEQYNRQRHNVQSKKSV